MDTTISVDLKRPTVESLKLGGKHGKVFFLGVKVFFGDLKEFFIFVGIVSIRF